MSKLYAVKLKTSTMPILLAVLFIGLFGFKGSAQVRVPFTPRTSDYTPDKTIYNVKGDFTMLGNTNLTLVNYGDTTHNGSTDMRYVDIDNDPNTINSSMAELKLSEENNANPECSNIIFAGLYWTGRAGSDNTFDVTSKTTGHNEIVSGTDYTMTVTRMGISGNYYPRYTFTSSGSGIPIIFECLNDTNDQVRYSTNGGSSWTVASNQNVAYNTPDTDSVVVSFDAVIVGTGNNTVKINALQKNENDNADENDTINYAYALETKELNKQKISLKGPNDSEYTNLIADANNIYYPSGIDNDIYSAYKDVTDYVKDHGLGNYYVADLALIEGNGGVTGYFGGWGMVVVYENSRMNWRDVTVFDGHAFVSNSVVETYELPVSGFNAVSNGDVNVKLGLMAGEGDNYYSGDYFKIRNAADSDWVPLKHSGNSIDNFFNSSIITGTNNRTPNLLNNTGLDISMFNLENTNNSLIGNNQTSTLFQYDSTIDTYVIFNITFSIETYVPENEGVLTTTALNGNSNPSSLTLLPGESADYLLNIRNKGTEATDNTLVTIPVPYTSSYKELSIQYHTYPPFSTTNVPYYDPNVGATGSIVWNLGTLPVSNNPNDILADISFTLVATTDCSLLVNASCDSTIAVAGSISGTGATSNISFNQQIIQGYETSGNCIGEPIPTPIVIVINAADYVNANCGNYTAVRDFYFCNIGSTPIQTSQVKEAFPPGTKYYNEYPLTENSVQFDASKPFPPTVGISTYYAIPPGSTTCYYQFTIEVSDVSSVPTVQNISYCLNEAASPLVATPSDAPDSPSAYTLYYYTDNDPSTSAQSSIVPLTTTAGETIYYVAEGLSNSCISPNRVPLKVTVSSPIIITLESSNNVACFEGATGAATIKASNGTAPYTYIWDDANAQTSANATGLVAGTYIVKVTDANKCSANASVTILAGDGEAPTASNPQPINIQCISELPNPDITVVTDAVDNVTANPTITFVSDVSNNMPCAEVITRTYNVADACGNSIDVIQTITIQDTTAPVTTTDFEATITVSCDYIPAKPVLEFKDNCDSDVTVLYDETNSFNENNPSNYEIIRTWKVSDVCSNEAIFTQTITVNLNDAITKLSDRACYDDGAINLDSYLDTNQTGGTWTVVEGNTTLDQNIFNPENVALGLYKFNYKIANNGCLTTIELTIEIHDECIALPCGREDVVISKVVTPNGDTFNDFFTVEGLETCGFAVELQIFNRWGAKIYENFNYKNDWNGYASKSSVGNADTVPNGTYYYIINLKDSGLKPFARAFYVGTK